MRRLLLPVLLLGALLAVPAAAQVPGAYPHLQVDDGQGGGPVPGAAGPFDNSGVLATLPDTVLSLDVSYAAEGQSTALVPWGLLVSLDATPFDTGTVPPPLFTQPPFSFVLPTPLMLTAAGAGSIDLAIPPGLYDGTTYVQALVYDSSSSPTLKLSNGVAVGLGPPAFNVRFSFAREVPALAVTGIQGVGTADIDADTLNTIAPLGSATPPLSTVTDVGLPEGLRFLPILPNRPDSPVNPLARPYTTLTENLSTDASIDVFPVADTRYFPPRGHLYVAQGGANPWSDKAAGINAPKLEVVTYTGRTPTSFTGVQRLQPGTTGSNNYNHSVDDVVLGDFTMAASAHAQARDRVCLDGSNDAFCHVVIPEVTFDGGPDVGEVTQDLDLFLYEDTTTGAQGFAVLDRTTHTWRVLGDTEIDTSDGRHWDPMVCVSPDRRSFVACVRVTTGINAAFPSDPDQVWAIRLDGLDWPATGTEAWQISYELQPEPETNDTFVRSREVHMPSVAILGTPSGGYVAFVGLAYKFKQSTKGDNRVQEGSSANSPWLGFEGFWVREDVIVRDVVEVPLVGPDSSKAVPSMPRPYITTQFGPIATTLPTQRLDPVPWCSDDGRTMLVSAGFDVDEEDVFLVRNVSITATGGVAKQIVNLSGYGFPGGQNTESAGVRTFQGGGQGIGPKAAFSPGGTRAAWVKTTNPIQPNRDWLNVARLSGADYAQVTNVYEDDDGNFQESGPYSNSTVIAGLQFADDDRLFFLMGQNPYNDQAALGANSTPRYDLFEYTISTDTMVNVTNTGGSLSGFGVIGKIRPLTSFLSPDRDYYYVVRSGPISQGNTILPEGALVTNVLGVELATGSLFDITGDEFTTTALVGNLLVPLADVHSTVEPPAAMEFMLGSGEQEGLVYFTAHRYGDETETDDLYAFDANDPVVAFRASRGSPPGSHITDVAPDPYGSVVAFARTAGSDPFVGDQHPFAVDLDNFLFERDLAPTFQVGGDPIGRLLDGSFRYVPPSGKAGEALAFSFGAQIDPADLLALQPVPLYYPLANVSNPLQEPVPLLLPLLSVNALGAGFRIYLGSVGLSTGE